MLWTVTTSASTVTLSSRWTSTNSPRPVRNWAVTGCSSIILLVTRINQAANQPMSAENDTEILLVEDSPYDAELTIRALTRRHLANKLVHVKDGAEALDFIFGGAYAARDTS